MSTTPIFAWPIPDPADAIHPAVRDLALAQETTVASLSAGGMSNPMTTLGDIIRGASAGAPQRLAVGSAGQVLTVVSGEPAWATPSALDGDLAAIAALTGTGFAKRTGVDTWSLTNPTASEVGLGNVTNDAQLKIASNLSDLANATTARTNLGVAIGSNVQAWDADLDAIAALVGTSGLLKKTGADTWTLDTATYLTANQTITLSGDISGSGSTSISTTIGAGKVTNAMLAGSIAASKLVGTDIATVGTLTAGATGAGFTVALSTSTITGTLADARLSANVAFRNAANSFAGHQTPAATDTYDLGSSTLLWRKGWLSELDSVLFSQNTQTLVGGWVVLSKNEGAIPVGQDIAAADTTIDFGQSMTVNDFVVFRSSLQVEYVQVGSLVSGTRYNVTRNLDASGANDWPAGSVYRVDGNTGNGRIELNANATPRISIFTQGATYNAQTELLRMGDLDGNWGISGATYGFAAGEYGAAGKAWEAVDPTNGIRLGVNTSTLFKVDTSGNVTMGEVATDQGNVFWNNSNKRLEFRGSTAGTVVQAYVDTAGSFTAGGGNVKLDAAGLYLNAASAFGAADQAITWKLAGVLSGQVSNIGTSSVSQSTLYATSPTATAVSVARLHAEGNTAHDTVVDVVATGSSYSGNANVGYVKITHGNNMLGVLINGSGFPTAMLDVRGDAVITGLLKAGSTPTTLTDSAGKILSAALNTVGVAQGGTGATSASSARTNLGLGTGDTAQFSQLGVGVTPAFPLDVTDSTADNNPSLHIYGPIPMLEFDESDGTADTRKWQIFANADLLQYRLANDARNSFTNILAINTSGNLAITRSIVIGSPTGGDKGAGSINAVTVYRNGTALDYVFEDSYDLLSIDKMASYFREHKHLPTIPTREVHGEGSTDMGALTDRLWETVECQALYITQLHERLKELENPKEKR